MKQLNKDSPERELGLCYPIASRDWCTSHRHRISTGHSGFATFPRRRKKYTSWVFVQWQGKDGSASIVAIYWPLWMCNHSNRCSRHGFHWYGQRPFENGPVKVGYKSQRLDVLVGRADQGLWGSCIAKRYHAIPSGWKISWAERLS